MERRTNQLLLVPLLVALTLLSFHGTQAIKYLNTNPSMTSNPSFNSDPTNEQLFGFRVAQFEFDSTPPVPSILVSAPRSDGMVASEGGVWMCNVTTPGCTFQPVFQARNNILKNDPFGEISIVDASYEGQLLGYSLKVFPSYIVVCAPLYITQILSANTHLYSTYNGRCTVLQRNLAPETLQVTASVVAFQGFRLAGLDTSYLDSFDETSFTEGLLMSSPLSPGDSQAPGGQLYATTLDSLSQTGNEHVLGENPPDNQPVTPLLGYRTETGKFTKSMKQVAASAPRAENHRGQIQIRDITPSSIMLESVITGPEEAVDGYFGYDFAVLDLQSKGFDSLVVGCPLCAKDSGAVYVYVPMPTEGDSTTAEFKSPQLVPSPSTERGRFGMAVENIGDIDLDGYPDVAIAAPYNGNGVVYIYRGYSGGLIANDYQEIPAAPDTKVFGYSLSGGLDLDKNNYPDLTIGALSGQHVLTYWSNPLVNVTLEFFDQKKSLDLTADRQCKNPDNPTVYHICFNVTPCFRYTPVEGDVPRFALEYTLTADSEKGRAGLLENLALNSVSKRVELDDGVVTCVEPQTFLIGNDFTETAPLLVQLEVTDTNESIPVPSSPDLTTDLIGVLNRYESENVTYQLSMEHMVVFDVNCGLDGCNPYYTIDLEESFTNTGPTGGLIVADNNVFSYVVTVANLASDDGLNPQLILEVPEGILFQGFESVTFNAASECFLSQNESVLTVCQLRNPINGGAQVTLKVFFKFDIATFSLETNSLSLKLSVQDGVSKKINDSESREIRVEAIGGYNLNVFVNEQSYLADRLVAADLDEVPLNETGPLVGFSVQVRHTRFDNNGTAIPQSTLAITLPTEIVLEPGKGPLPLLVLTDVLPDQTTNCSYAVNAIPSGIASLPTSFDLPPWTGPAPTPHSSCAKDGVTCGVILCTIRNLRPNSESVESVNTFVELEFFARLYSPSIKTRLQLAVYATVTNDTSVVTILEEESVTDVEETFSVLPAVRETAKDCVEYWIVVVSVVAGIIVLCIIIFILACLGLFRRWYKRSKEEAAVWMDQPDDDEFVYRRRTIPPIPGVTQGRSSPTLVAYTAAGAENGDGGSREAVDLEKEKEAEAEREIELQVQMSNFQSSSMARSKSSSPPAIQAPLDESELEKYSYDPHKGVDDEFEGMETEI